MTHSLKPLVHVLACVSLVFGAGACTREATSAGEVTSAGGGAGRAPQDGPSVASPEGAGAAAGNSGAAGSVASDGGGSAAAGLGINDSIWTLQLPIGSGTSPTTISASQLKSGYSSAYFYPAADGGQLFMVPQTGITTSGSAHCRTELRELTASGSAAAWSASGTNRLTVSGKVLQLGGGPSGVVTLGQLFNSTDSIPLVELQYSMRRAGLQMLYEEAKGAGSTTDLSAPVALDTRYSFTLELTQGVLSVGVDGKIVHTETPSAGVLAKAFYFKVGNYDQTASAGAISTTPYTVVEVYEADVVHE